MKSVETMSVRRVRWLDCTSSWVVSSPSAAHVRLYSSCPCDRSACAADQTPMSAGHRTTCQVLASARYRELWQVLQQGLCQEKLLFVGISSILCEFADDRRIAYFGENRRGQCTSRKILQQNRFFCNHGSSNRYRRLKSGVGTSLYTQLSSTSCILTFRKQTGRLADTFSPLAFAGSQFN